jgi:hypothetical protein
MFSYLISMMMLLSPTATGGNGHHWGWRNQAPRVVPTVQLVTPRPPTVGGTSSGTPGDPNPGPRFYGN